MPRGYLKKLVAAGFKLFSVTRIENSCDLTWSFHLLSVELHEEEPEGMSAGEA